MTDNPNKLAFRDMPRADQDKIAGAWVRGEPLEVWETPFPHGGFETWWPCESSISKSAIYRLPTMIADGSLVPEQTPLYMSITAAKDPQRPRPLHKLGVNYGDVVKLVARQDGSTAGVGLEFTVGLSGVVEFHMWNPAPKGHRPLFVIVSRAGGEA